MKGWGPKCSVCPLKPGKSNIFGGISGTLLAYPGLRNKSLCSIFGLYKTPARVRHLFVFFSPNELCNHLRKREVFVSQLRYRDFTRKIIEAIVSALTVPDNKFHPLN